MPGKHAPESPLSFYLSLARWGGLVLGAIGVLVAIGLVITGGSEPKTLVAPTSSASPSVTGSASPRPTPTPTPTASKASSVRPPAQTTVSVLNGTQRAGLARTVGNQLDEEGYDVVERANYGKNAPRTTIFYREGWAAEARALLRKHPELQQVKAAPSDLPGKAGLTIILGQDYP